MLLDTQRMSWCDTSDIHSFVVGLAERYACCYFQRFSVMLLALGHEFVDVGLGS